MRTDVVTSWVENTKKRKGVQTPFQHHFAFSCLVLLEPEFGRIRGEISVEWNVFQVHQQQK